MANEPMIPAGMKPWAGGDAAPADWDRSTVLLADGRVAGLYGTAGWRAWVAHGGERIIAYTPRTPTELESGAADERVRVLREALEEAALVLRLDGERLRKLGATTWQSDVTRVQISAALERTAS